MAFGTVREKLTHTVCLFDCENKKNTTHYMYIIIKFKIDSLVPFTPEWAKNAVIPGGLNPFQCKTKMS